MSDSDVLSLKWSRHRSTFLSVLTALKAKGVFSDVTVVCGSQVFAAHKLVLAASSPYFQHILAQLPATRLHQTVMLVLQDICPEDFECLLDYMYLGEASVLQSNLARLIQASEKLRIRGLAGADSDEELKLDNDCMKSNTHSSSCDSNACSSSDKSKKRKSCGGEGSAGIEKRRKNLASGEDVEDDKVEDDLRTTANSAARVEAILNGSSIVGVACASSAANKDRAAAQQERNTNQATSSSGGDTMTPADLVSLIKHEALGAEDEEEEETAACEGDLMEQEWTSREQQQQEQHSNNRKSIATLRLRAFNGVVLLNQSTCILPKRWILQGPGIRSHGPTPRPVQCLLPPPSEGDFDLLVKDSAMPSDGWKLCPATVIVTAKSYESCARKLQRTLAQEGEAAAANASSSSDDEAPDDMYDDKRLSFKSVNGDGVANNESDHFRKEMRMKFYGLRSELKSLKAKLSRFTGPASTSDLNSGQSVEYNSGSSHHNHADHNGQAADHKSDIISEQHSLMMGSLAVMGGGGGSAGHGGNEEDGGSGSVDAKTGQPTQQQQQQLPPPTALHTLPTVASEVPPPPACNLTELDYLLNHPNVMVTLIAAATGSIQEAVKGVLQRLMTRELILRFSFTGMGRRRQYCKLCFKDHRAYTLVFSALIQALPNISSKEINDRLKVSLRQACDWRGGRGSRKRNMPDFMAAYSEEYRRSPASAAAAEAGQSSVQHDTSSTTTTSMNEHNNAGAAPRESTHFLQTLFDE